AGGELAVDADGGLGVGQQLAGHRDDGLVEAGELLAGRAGHAEPHAATSAASGRWKHERSPVWQAGPSWSTSTSSASPSQSSRTSRTHCRCPEVSPLTQYSLRLRDQYVARPVVSVRCRASSSIQATISTSPVSCCWTTAATRPLGSRRSSAAMSGARGDSVGGT